MFASLWGKAIVNRKEECGTTEPHFPETDPECSLMSYSLISVRWFMGEPDA
jgi:hypothetical protein